MLSQNSWVWANQILGRSWNQGYDISTDSENNVYVVGFFEDTIQFSNQTFGDGCQYYCQTGFVVKYGYDGTLGWANVFNTSYSSFVEEIAIDHEDNIIIAGTFFGDVWIGPYHLQNPSLQDYVFVAKINPQGDVLWVRQGSCLNQIGITSLAVDNANNIYAAGINWDQANFDNLIVPDAGMFIVKFNANGTPLNVINESGCVAYSIAVADDYNLYLSGKIYATSVLGSDTVEPFGYYQIQYIENDTDTVYVTSSDLLFIRYDSLGNVIWHRSATSKGYNDIRASALDANSNFYVTGTIGDTTNFWGTTVPYNLINKTYLLKLDSLGNVSWVKQSSSISNNGRIYFTDITCKNDFLYLVGIPFEQSSFGGVIFNSPSNKQSTFILKLDTDGNGILLKMDTTNFARNEPRAISIDENDDFLLTGFFEDSVHFDEHYLNAVNNPDLNMFVAKMHIGPIGITETSTISTIIYPNPATEIITIKGDTPARITLCNTIGQTVAEFSNTNQIYVGSLAKGMYVLQLYDIKGELLKTEKVVKE